MSKATLRREEARGLFMDEGGPFGETDTFLNEIYPVGVEAKVLESCKQNSNRLSNALEMHNLRHKDPPTNLRLRF